MHDFRWLIRRQECRVKVALRIAMMLKAIGWEKHAAQTGTLKERRSFG